MNYNIENDLIKKEAGDADPDAICAAAKKMSMDEVMMDKLEGYADKQGWSVAILALFFIKN